MIVDVHLASQQLKTVTLERKSVSTRLHDVDASGSTDAVQLASSTSELTQTQRRDTSTQQRDVHTDPQRLTSALVEGLTPEQAAAMVDQIVQPITDQVVGVGETAMFECRLRHRSSSCDVTWLVFSAEN